MKFGVFTKYDNQAVMYPYKSIIQRQLKLGRGQFSPSHTVNGPNDSFLDRLGVHQNELLFTKVVKRETTGLSPHFMNNDHDQLC